MEILLSLAVGVLVACGIYLLLSRNLIRLVLGLSLLSNAFNLIVFTAGRLSRAVPPLIPEGAETAPAAAANPLPQALILTAIVIGFGLLAFALVLTFRAYQRLETVDTAAMRDAEPPQPETARLPGTAPARRVTEVGRGGHP